MEEINVNSIDSSTYLPLFVLTYSKYPVIKTCKMVRFVNHIITTIFV